METVVAVTVAAAAAALLHLRHGAWTARRRDADAAGGTHTIAPGYHDRLEVVTDAVLHAAAVSAAASRRGPRVAVRGAVLYVPPRDDWAVDFGPSGWRDKVYRARTVSGLFVLNWSSAVPTLVGGGVEAGEQATPHVALNREVREELGEEAAGAFQFGPQHYQFSRVTSTGPATHQVRVVHHYAVLLRDRATYAGLLRHFFDFDRPTLTHEVHGAVSLPLALEAPRDLAKVRRGGWNVIGLPSYLTHSLRLVAGPLVLHLRRFGLVSEAEMHHILDLASMVTHGHGGGRARRPFNAAVVLGVPGAAAVAAKAASGGVITRDMYGVPPSSKGGAGSK